MHKIDNTYLTLDKLHRIIYEEVSIELSEDAISKIQSCRSFLDDKTNQNNPIYGINTSIHFMMNHSVKNKGVVWTR